MHAFGAELTRIKPRIKSLAEILKTRINPLLELSAKLLYKKYYKSVVFDFANNKKTAREARRKKFELFWSDLGRTGTDLGKSGF